MIILQEELLCERKVHMRIVFLRVKIWFHSLKMSKKLCLSFVSLTFVSILFIHNIYARIYERDMKNNVRVVFEQTVINCGDTLENLIKDVEAIAGIPIFFSQLQVELGAGKKLSSESTMNLSLSISMTNLSNIGDYLIMLYNINNERVFANMNIKNSEFLKQDHDEWIKVAKEMNGKTCLLPISDENSLFDYVVVKSIKSIPDFEDVGVMTICIPSKELKHISTSLEKIEGTRILILNEFDEVIFEHDNSTGGNRENGDDAVRESENDNVIPEEISAFLDSKVIINEDTVRIDTDRYLGYYMEQSRNKYKILTYAYKEDVFRSLDLTQRLMTMIMFVVGCAAILLIIVLSASITRPLQKITMLMEKVQHGDWSVRFRAKYTDEVGILGKNFNIMLDNMNEMLNSIVDMNNKKKQIEIDLLKSQINPHFMYNTLETFRMMAEERDDEELADLIFRFGKMMRYNVTSMNEITTIEKELDYLMDYIEIQNSRYNHKIILEFDIPDELMHYPMIKLLIQPIVENSVFHGMKRDSRKVNVIGIKMYVQRNDCIIEISDNGAGISEVRLKELREKLKINYTEAETSNSIGLRNVDERISLFYGKEYGINVNSVEGEGTLVTITLPYSIAQNKKES